MQLEKPGPAKRYKPSAAVDADLMQINRTDFATTLILAEALLWSSMALFEHTIYELDCNWNPTGFTLPPGKYPFIPKSLAEHWDDEMDDARSIALFELSQPGAASTPLHRCKFPPEFQGRIMIRVQHGFVLLIGAGAARTVKAWPAPKPAVKVKRQPESESGQLFETGR